MEQEQAVVQWRIENGVGHIVLNRVDAANALDSATARLLEQAIAQAARGAGHAVRSVLVSARGPVFCAGGDIREFAARRADLDALVRDVLDTLHPAILTLTQLSVPVISAVQGSVGGAGIALALSADIVLGSSAMKLRGGYSAIALSPDLGASYHLTRRAGAARAKYVLMTNRAITADECLSWGLVDELHAPEALAAAAEALAVALAQGATPSLAGIKGLCDAALSHDLRTHLDLEREALLRAAASAHGREGVSAFVERRVPQYAAVTQQASHTR